jgi:hypothetical protein
MVDAGAEHPDLEGEQPELLAEGGEARAGVLEVAGWAGHVAPLCEGRPSGWSCSARHCSSAVRQSPGVSARGAGEAGSHSGAAAGNRKTPGGVDYLLPAATPKVNATRTED